MTPRIQRSRRFRARRGSALVLVLIMTLSLAGLAISAIYLSSSAGLLTRYYDKERDFKYAAEAALAMGKSRVNKDTTIGLPEDTAKRLMTGASLTDAGGTTIPKIRVNLYGAYTGDTVGRFGAFVTLLAQSYDTGGTRTVRRLDLSAESFSRYAMFVDSFPSGLVYGTGEFIRGRAHSNTNWYSGSAPGPIYYDTVSAFGTINGTGQYNGIPTLPGSKKVPYPTVAKLASLPGYATTGNLNFTPVSGSAAPATSGINVSGRLDGANAVRGTRLRFSPVDLNADGILDEEEGFIQVFDLASGIDTSSLRADLPRSGSTPVTNIVMLNQCGLMVTISGRKEFFPVARFRENWVRARVRGSTSPVISDADTVTMKGGNAAAYNKILSYSGASRCYPAGSSYLMLTERYVTNSAGTCVVTTSTAVTPRGWASPGSSCAQYGGQDTTFTQTVTRCQIDQTAALPAGSGLCTNNQVALGAWRVFPGTAVASVGTKRQAAERTYLWPLFKPNNLASKGVIHATSGPLFISDTLRGNVTLYVLGGVDLIDDVYYDQDPTTATCRNFLGIIAQNDVMITDNAMNRPRPDAGGTFRFLGTPDATLHMVTMSLTGTVGVENYAGNQITSPAVQCQGNPQSGGCINQTGGVIVKYLSATYAGNNTGLRENRSVDPCQLTNRKPPFFPMTQRYLENKYYEIDPVNVDSWTQVKAFYAKLRGRSSP
jgi:hypothetical protein